MVETASEDEVAAITAAVTQFVAETGSAMRGAPEAVSPWWRAALAEGVGAKRTAQDPKGGVRWLS